MQIDVKKLKNIPLFFDIKEEDFEALFLCVGAWVGRYAREEFISLDGDVTKSIGVVLSGRAEIIKEDVFGNRTVMSSLGEGDVFGEAFVCGGHFAQTVSVQATRACEILFMPFENVMDMNSNRCAFRTTLVKNMVIMLSNKNLKLLEKLEVTTKHSLREKVLTYLSHLAQEQGSTTVLSPLGRSALADFFGADRSALTRELGRMADEGLITFEKNTYTLTDVFL